MRRDHRRARDRDAQVRYSWREQAASALVISGALTAAVRDKESRRSDCLSHLMHSLAARWM
jgi:hypothetical protein